jgi:hypothetical protein
MDLYEKQMEIRSKGSELEKIMGRGGTVSVAVSRDENYTLLVLFIFSTKMYKIYAVILGYSV